MNDTVTKALPLWGLDNAQWHLIATRENQVYRIETASQSFAMRLHRQGYRTDAELWSELQWMAVAAKGGLHVPTPIVSKSDTFLHKVNGIQVDVLSWLDGKPMGQSKQALDMPDRPHFFYRLGSEMAHLHTISDAWSIPERFTRCQWDRKGLVGDIPVWGCFWENPALSKKDRKLFLTIREHTNEQLKLIENSLDYGLIHADLVRENIMVQGEKIQLIDFDDSGYGFRLFDIATTLLANKREPDYTGLREALIEGYKSQRTINTDHLDLFLLLRATTYVGWIMTRMQEAGSADRNNRFIANVRALAHNAGLY